MKLFIFTMLLVSMNASAGWFGFGTKELTAAEKESVNDGICGCSVGRNQGYVATFNDAQADKTVQATMAKLQDSLIATYKVETVKCKKFSGTPNAIVARERKICISTYSNFGDDRSLKTEAEALK